MIRLCPGTPQEISNIERMLKFIGNVELKNSDVEGEPLFDKQKVFDSQVFQRSYYIYAKGRSILSPIRIKFVYNMREQTAEIKAAASDVEILNRIILGRKDVTNEVIDKASQSSRNENTEYKFRKQEA
jgi:hypothetical protein